MKLSRWSVVLASSAILLNACVRTEVINEVTSQAPGSPFRRILVCSISGDADGVARLQRQMSDRLRKHGVAAQICDDVLSSSSTLTSAEAEIREKFDAILVTRREPRPDMHGDNLHAVLLSPKTAAMPSASQRAMDLPRPSSIEGFFKLFQKSRQQSDQLEASSEQTVLEPYGKEKQIYGAADLLSVKGDQLIWSVGGYVAGGKKESPAKFTKALVNRVEIGLEDHNLIP